jgi:hypothetical protein
MSRVVAAQRAQAGRSVILRRTCLTVLNGTPRSPRVEGMYKSIPQPIVQYSICTSRMLGLRGRAQFFRPREQGGVFPLPGDADPFLR